MKFHVLNVHTLAELKLTGNHLKGSRPVLSFDASFDQQPHLQVSESSSKANSMLERGLRAPCPGFVQCGVGFRLR